ncbi:hypothetical protein [Merismopedia glauca]|nr:hypothetical protein [Merismopedia glauca]
MRKLTLPLSVMQVEIYTVNDLKIIRENKASQSAIFIYTAA